MTQEPEIVEATEEVAQDALITTAGAITRQIDAEDAEVGAILDQIKRQIASGDVRQGLFEQLVEVVKVKNQKSEKMLKLLDSMIKMKKVQSGVPSVGINIQMSPGEKKDFLKSL